MVFEEICEAFDAFSREDCGCLILIVLSQDGETSVFRSIIRCEVASQPIFILATHLAQPADGEDEAWRRHDQAARLARSGGRQFQAFAECLEKGLRR